MGRANYLYKVIIISNLFIHSLNTDTCDDKWRWRTFWLYSSCVFDPVVTRVLSYKLFIIDVHIKSHRRTFQRRLIQKKWDVTFVPSDLLSPWETFDLLSSSWDLNFLTLQSPTTRFLCFRLTNEDDRRKVQSGSSWQVSSSLYVFVHDIKSLFTVVYYRVNLLTTRRVLLTYHQAEDEFL